MSSTTEELRVLNPDQANARRLSTLPKIARANQYTLRTLQMWRKRFDDFPQPQAILTPRDMRQKQLLFDVREFLQWLEDAQFEGKIRYR